MYENHKFEVIGFDWELVDESKIKGFDLNTIEFEKGNHLITCAITGAKFYAYEDYLPILVLCDDKIIGVATRSDHLEWLVAPWNGRLDPDFLKTQEDEYEPDFINWSEVDYAYGYQNFVDAALGIMKFWYAKESGAPEQCSTPVQTRSPSFYSAGR